MKPLFSLLTAAVLAASAQAQGSFSFDAGMLAERTKYDVITKLNTAPAIGGTLGTFFVRNVSLDLSTSFGPNRNAFATRSRLIQNNRAELVLNTPLTGKWKGMVGGGWTDTGIGGDQGDKAFEAGLIGLIGLRYCANERWSWTYTLMGDYKDPADQAAPASGRSLAWTARVGLVRSIGKNRENHPCYVAPPLPAPPPDALKPAPAPEPAPQPPAAPQPPVRPEPPPIAQPAPAPALPPLMTFTPVYFGFDQAVLTKAAKDTLETVVLFLKANPSANVLVTGHTDSRGDDNYNARLGARRAIVSRNYLVSKGIAVGRITTSTRGESDPQDSNTTVAGRARNRRAIAVEIRP